MSTRDLRFLSLTLNERVRENVGGSKRRQVIRVSGQLNVVGSDNCCNSSSLLLVHIVFFGLSLKVFKMRLLERGFHSYKECFVLLPNRRGISQSTPFGAQRPRWYLFLSLIDMGPPIYPLSGPTPLLAHHLMSTPLQSSAFSLAHRPVS